MCAGQGAGAEAADDQARAIAQGRARAGKVERADAACTLADLDAVDSAAGAAAVRDRQRPGAGVADHENVAVRPTRSGAIDRRGAGRPGQLADLALRRIDHCAVAHFQRPGAGVADPEAVVPTYLR